MTASGYRAPAARNASDHSQVSRKAPCAEQSNVLLRPNEAEVGTESEGVTFWPTERADKILRELGIKGKINKQLGINEKITKQLGINKKITNKLGINEKIIKKLRIKETIPNS